MTTIQDIRKATGLSQSRFAAALGIPVRTIQKWEIGGSTPAPYLVELIRFRIEHDETFGKDGTQWNTDK